jgi:Protein of unknown function (DUF3106)
MPWRASRYDSTTYGCPPPERGGVIREGVFSRCATLALLIVAAALPLAFGQHANHGGGGSHAPAPPQASAPHMSAPHMSAPNIAAPHASAPHMQAPSPAYRGPAYGAPAYRGAPPGYAPRPYVRTPIAPGPPHPIYGPGPYPAPRAPYAAPPGNIGGPHLGNWLESHQGESFVGQENALRREPGFNRLPQPQQQRLIDRLHQLDTMPPQQRQRTLGRIENMERLSPDRRQAVRNSAQELGNMDPARKQQVRGAFRVLRDMPPGQREQVLNSPAYRSMYSDHERQILGNLLSVEPYAH